MNHYYSLEKIKHADFLIRTQKTGNPEEIASKLKISLRCWHNLKNEMIELGAPIFYDKCLKTYYYKEPVDITCEIKWTRKNEKNEEYSSQCKIDAL